MVDGDVDETHEMGQSWTYGGSSGPTFFREGEQTSVAKCKRETHEIETNNMANVRCLRLRMIIDIMHSALRESELEIKGKALPPHIN